MLDLSAQTKFLAMEQQLEIFADSGLFKGLANQNMLFHECICELVDNSIASKKDAEPFKVDIIFSKIENSPNYYVYIVDNSKGMTYDTFRLAMQPGQSATLDSRLNEHGFGLKHALATLTKNTGYWKIWAKDFNTGKISSVKYPFQRYMKIEDDDTFPNLPYPINSISTIVQAEVNLEYIQSVQGRGQPAQDLFKLRAWLLEHLGIIYRGYLTPDQMNNWEIEGTIIVSIDTDKAKVIPIEIPMEGTKRNEIVVELSGKNYTLLYITGLIDEKKRNSYFNNVGLKANYLQGTLTQGIDIRLGKRVIATKVLKNIWGLAPHPKFNEFVAELIIPELPRNVLRTVNNKTDIDFDDKEWHKIFDILKEEHKLPENPRFALEEELRIQWKNKLSAGEPRDTVLTDKSIWSAGVEVDVYREKFDSKEITIYELKAGAAKPIDVYQLKMYWDGLVLQGEYPSNGWLICENGSDRIIDMINRINLMTPQKNAHPYKFSLKTLDELQLIKTSKKKK
jgi:hypothetical protein